MKKTILLWFLCLALVLTGCASGEEAAAVPFSGGTGTEADPYLLSTPEDLWELAERTEQEDGKAYASAWYLFTGDIDLGGKEKWIPIGSDATPFTGVLDGGGYTLSGLLIQGSNKVVGQEEKHFGLMYTLQGTVRNLTISNSKIQVTQDGAWTGAFAGDAFRGVFENCHTTATVQITGTYQTAGICANISKGSVLTGCTNAADISCTSEEGGAAGISVYVSCPVIRCGNTGTVVSQGDSAGIAVSANAGLEGCTNEGRISARGYAAGVVCRFSDGALNHDMNDDTVSVQGCTNSGEVTSSEKSAGGIATGCRTGRMADCTNSGKVSAPMEAGGIFAYFQPSAFGEACEEFRVTGCTNTATVTAKDNYAAGGICSTIYGGSTRLVLESCTNTGLVQATGQTDVLYSGAEAGGIVGKAVITELVITGCENSGDVNGYACAGGIAGYVVPDTGCMDASFRAENCTNRGRVYAADPGGLKKELYAGGILGYSRHETEDPELLPAMGSVTFTGCENTGALQGDQASARFLSDDLWASNPGGA